MIVTAIQLGDGGFTMSAQIGFFAAADVHLDNEDRRVWLDILGPVQAFLEGDDGTTAYRYTIYRDGDDLSGSQSARWSVQGYSGYDLAFGSANAEDFEGGVLPSGIVTFNPGETIKTITVLVRGDHTPEAFLYEHPN
jgi:hypothetical protein